MKKHKKLAWVGLLLVLPLILSAASCQRTVVEDEPIDNSTSDDLTDDTTDSALDDLLPSENNQPITPSGLPDPAIIDAESKVEVQIATDFIKLIQPDAVLTALASKYRNSLSNTYGLLTNYYIFTSSSEPGYYYLVNRPRDGLSKMVRFIMPIQDFALDFDLLPVPFEWWNINYAKALQLAETQGGGDVFRSKHANFDVSAILAIPVTEYLTWSITYKATDNSGDLLKIQIDANTGTVEIIPLFL